MRGSLSTGEYGVAKASLKKKNDRLRRESNDAHPDFCDAIRDSTTILKRGELLVQILHVGRMLTWEWNPETNEVYQSQNAAEILGTRCTTVGEFFSLVHPDDRDRVNAALQLYLCEKKSYAPEFRIIRKDDGTIRWIEDRGHAILDSGGKVVHMAGICLDVTERKHYEEALKRSNEKLEEQKRTLEQRVVQRTLELAQEKAKLERSNRELEQFAGVAAHDLRAPLKSMRGWVDMLDYLTPKPHPPELVKALEFIRRNTCKAERLIDDLLQVARINITGIEPTEVDLDQVLSNLLLVLKEEIDESHARVECDHLPTVTGNPSHLESVFSNLIQNALTYHDPERAPRISISSRDLGDSYEFSVTDNGIGIKPEDTDRIFEMFKRLHNDSEHPGTGIGLAYCKKVVELCGGRIWVRSKPGQGSTFFFVYPKRLNWGAT